MPKYIPKYDIHKCKYVQTAHVSYTRELLAVVKLYNRFPFVNYTRSESPKPSLVEDRVFIQFSNRVLRRYAM